MLQAHPLGSFPPHLGGQNLCRRFGQRGEGTFSTETVRYGCSRFLTETASVLIPATGGENHRYATRLKHRSEVIAGGQSLKTPRFDLSRINDDRHLRIAEFLTNEPCLGTTIDDEADLVLSERSRGH